MAKAILRGNAVRAADPGSVHGRPRMSAEVHVLQPLARQVRVELRGGDVRVAEHLLHRSQVAAPREQVGGEGVTQRVRADAIGEPGRDGVAADDLVEALAGQRAAAEIDEHMRFGGPLHQAGPSPLEVCAQRLRGRLADRHHALLRALPPRTEHTLLQVDVGQLEPDRLRSAEAAGVHQLEQRTVPQRGRLRASRLREQSVDLPASEDVGQLTRAPRRAQRGGGVRIQQAFPAHVAVEGAQAGGLPVDRRRRRRRPLDVAGREFREEIGDVAGPRLERGQVAAREEAAELEQVGPVRLERVAGESALEFEVGEEVEHEVLEALLCEGLLDRCHQRTDSAAAPTSLDGARRTSAAEVGPKPEEADQGLRIPTAGDHVVEVYQRHLHDLDPLGVVGLRLLVIEIRRQVDVALLVREAGRGVEARQVLPGPGALADLLRELALGRIERLLPLLVELAGRKLEERLLLNGLARLPDQIEALAIVGHHRHRPGVGDDLAFGLLAVVVAEAVDPDGGNPPLPRGLAADALERHALAATSASVTSSIVSSASTVTDSSGWWLRSVPFAMFTTGRPAATKALASLPPPVAMYLGSIPLSRSATAAASTGAAGRGGREPPENP